MTPATVAPGEPRPIGRLEPVDSLAASAGAEFATADALAAALSVRLQPHARAVLEKYEDLRRRYRSLQLLEQRLSGRVEDLRERCLALDVLEQQLTVRRNRLMAELVLLDRMAAESSIPH